MRRIKRSWSAYLFVLPAFLFFVVFVFKPMIEGILFGFFKVGIAERTFVGFKNYKIMVSDPLFWIALKNTLIFLLIVVPMKVFLALIIALILSRYGHSIQSFFRGAFYLPAISAGVVITYVWWWIFNPLYGPLNYLLSLVGIPQIMWLSEPNWARLAVILVLLNWTIGLGVILYLSALAAIPKSIYEAADVDGASSLRKCFNITIPLILPITVFILVITTIGVFQMWEVIFLLTSGGPNFATTSIVLRIFNLGFVDFDFGLASAHATVLLLMTFIVVFFQFRWLNKEVEF